MRKVRRPSGLGGRTRRRWGVAAGVVLCASVVAIVAWARLGPLPEGLLDPRARTSVVITDRRGEVLFEARDADGLRGEWLSPADVPAVVRWATLAAEDRRFFKHAGLDPRAIVRAAWRNIRARRVVEGGSTITQQVAELLLARQHGRRSSGWRAKAWEAVVALRLEHRLTKDEILAWYLNLAPYGNQIQGVERAARAYLGGSLQGERVVTPAEAALLAALPQQPGRYNPWRDPSAARARQARILTTMADEGWLAHGTLRAAIDERMALHHEANALPAPHFVERVLADTAARPAHHVETTLDAGLQRTVQGIIAAHRAELDRHHARHVAVAVLDNRTAEWLVWEGSGDYWQPDGGAIDGVVAARQPGSALKPFTYAAAFERGAFPGSVLADVPSQFPTAEPGILYSPENYDGRFRGPLLARAALAGSENVPAVALASQIGVPALARMLRSVGLSTLDHNAAHYGLGLTLGNAEVRLDELVSAYAVLARGGDRLEPTRVRRVDDQPLPERARQKVLDDRTAFWLADILADDEARAYIFGRGGSLEFPFTVAAKTGTSQAYHDNWAIGFTRDVTVGVWVGNFDRTPLRGSSGVTGAGPIFHDVLLAAVERVRGALPIGDRAPLLPAPVNVRRATLCAVSGMAATDHCVRRVTEWVADDRPLTDCTWHLDTERGLVTAWPGEYEAWARAAGLWRDPASGAPLPDVLLTSVVHDAGKRPEAGQPAGADGLAIVAPVAGATYYIDPTLRPEFQALPLRAAGAAPGGTLTWSIDGQVFGATRAGETLRWPLAPGRHHIVVEDEGGHSAETRVEVR